VLVKGTIAEIESNYCISVAPQASSLLFSFVGYETQEVAINVRNTINITLALDSCELGEIIVTALRIKREKKVLGYAVQ